MPAMSELLFKIGRHGFFSPRENVFFGLLISLGAPFWYNALKNLLKLKSVLSEKDDAQRAQRCRGETGHDDVDVAGALEG